MLRNGKVLKITAFFFPQFQCVGAEILFFMRTSQAEHASAKVALSH